MRVLLVVFVIQLCLSCLNGAKEFEVTRKIEQKQHTVTCNNTKYHISLFKATRTEKGLENDVIHYIVAAINRPTIIMRHVFNGAEVVLNETNICSMKGQTVTFTDDANKPEYSGVIISNIFPFLDSDDNVALPNNVHEIFHNQENVLEYFNWELASGAVQSSSDNSAAFTGTPSEYGIFNKSSLSFEVQVRSKDGYQASLPGYPMNANLTQFFIKMVSLPGTAINASSSKNLRYAVELFYFSVNNKEQSADYQLVQSIDDEYSPGVFETWAATIPQKQPVELKPCQTFVSWKPVGYKKATPSYENEAFAHVNIYKNGQNSVVLSHKGKLASVTEEVPWTIAHHVGAIFFGVNITLGAAKDEGYQKSGYMQWSGMIGSGKPPLDIHLSSFAITVITLGLGGPFVAGFLIAVFVWIIRRLWKSNSAGKSKYAPID